MVTLYKNQYRGDFMKKNAKNFLLISSVTMVVAATLSTIHHFTAKHLMRVALNREAPKSIARKKEQLISSADLTEVMQKISVAATELENKCCETVEITAHDGTKLVGHWHCGTNPKRVVVAMHGWRSSWSSDFGMIADFWHDNDCAVLYAEQRGQGTSGGAYRR